MQCLGQMPGLRGLDLHHYEGRVGNPLTHILSRELVEHLVHCKHLTWLDISLWTLNETQVGVACILVAELVGSCTHVLHQGPACKPVQDRVILSGHTVWVTNIDQDNTRSIWSRISLCRKHCRHVQPLNVAADSIMNCRR